MLPLFVKYKTKTGNRYVYDDSTGEILHVGDVVYQILGDYQVLTAEEICKKHFQLGEEAVREALEQLDEAKHKGVLSSHDPEISARVASACCETKPRPLRDLIANRRRLLTLEVTHRCNLACEYCCFGEHYDRSRKGSAAAMSLETAKQAVSEFLSHKPARGAIGFYGGEPLMEFELIKEIVDFAEDLAKQHGIDSHFSMTTNGTLLSDEKIHYLAAHNFSVMISLDGDRETHDRYRVFKNASHNEERRGSFDVVIRNMERFVELYPNYHGRGIVLTLTATADFAEVEKFVAKWKPLFPAFASNTVVPVPGRLEALRGGCPIEVGQFDALDCGDTSCTRRHPDVESSGEIPEFDDWPTGGSAAIRSSLDRYVTELCQTDGIQAAQTVRGRFPICGNLLDNRIRSIHRRRILGRLGPKPPVVRLSCFPGATRTYCSIQGVLFPCEKTEFGELFAIGRARSDIDADKVCNVLIELVRLACDCGNCIVNKFCGLCPAVVTESPEMPGSPDFLALQRTCSQRASESGLAARLREYTEVMEVNPKLLDQLYAGMDSANEDWLVNVKALVEKKEDVELQVEELAGWV